MPIFTPIDFDPFAGEKEIEKIILTNEPQREIWLSCVIGGSDANLSYNESVSLVITGTLNVAAFKKAVDHLVDRHEALRATISPNGETLIIYKSSPVALAVENICGESESEKYKKLNDLLINEIDTALDLQEGPLFKVYLHKISDTEYYFTIIKHHVIGDGWSTGIMLEDLSKMYNAYSNGDDIVLEVASQLSDYASAQASFKLSAAHQKTEDYWLGLYKNNVPVLDLPTDFPRLSPRTYKGNRIDHPLSNDMVGKLKAIGAKAGCSLVTTLLAAFEVFLYQKTHQKNLVVGLPSSGQAASGLNDVVGHCVNLLPLKSFVDPQASFTGYLKTRKKEVLDAYDHQRLTFGELIKKLYIPRDAARITLVPVIFNIDMGMDNAVYFTGLDYKLISNPRRYENFELYLNATKSEEGIIFEWSYNTGLFKEETIQQFNKDYNLILEAIIEDPGMRISTLINEEEGQSRHNVVVANEVYLPANETVITQFEAIVQKYPDKIAVTFNSTSLSYLQLNEKVDQLASFLIQKGARAGDIIALSLDRSVEMLISLLAILKSGAIYLPLDPEYPQDRIDFMLEDSSATILITDARNKSKYEAKSQAIVIDEIWPQLNDVRQQLPQRTIDGEDVAYILYTSGSTGKPKGVKVCHRNLNNFLVSMHGAPGIVPADRLLAITTISFDIAGLEMYLPLIAGAELVIADIETTKDGRLLLELIEEKNISIMQATPSTWQMMLDSGWKKKYPLKVLCGGEALPKELAGKLLPRCEMLWNMYGPTETTIWSTIKQILPGEELITVGGPIINTSIYIVDEKGRQVADGDVGEILIGGQGVTAGYLNRPELTAEKFIDDVFSTTVGARLYKTGDLGKRLDNGELQCLGRVDQQVKIRGHRIELGEIESIILQQKEIKQAAVKGIGESSLDMRIVAYVILDENAIIYDKDSTLVENGFDIPNKFIQSWTRNLNEILPPYMVPDDFIVLEKFPLTPNGKIDRNALPKPQPKKKPAGTAKPVILTRNEQLVTNIWSETLGIEGLKPSDDFFELGGHSLLAVKVMVAIEDQTGTRLPLATLFTNPTIEKLALQLSGDKTTGWDTIVPIKPTGKKPPLFLVHGSGLNLLMFKSISEHFDEDQPLYGIQAIGLSKPAEIPDTLEGVAAYHIREILRVNPDGPYSIAGYSYGGFIAYEIMKQLIATGKKVKFIGMIDTNTGDLTQPHSKTELLAKKAARQFYKIPFFINSFIKYPKESLAYQQLVFKRKFSGIYQSESVVAKDRYTLYEKEIAETYRNLINGYRIVPLDVSVALLRAEKRLYFLDDQKYLGWDKFALKGVEIFKVPGDHKTFLEPPNDEHFAKIIQKAIDRND